MNDAFDLGDHPERGEDEIYLGNMTYTDFRRSSWGKLRMGNTARDKSGKELQTDTRPVFLPKSEVRAKVELLEEDPANDYELSPLRTYRELLKRHE